jgi:hypothetical protein
MRITAVRKIPLRHPDYDDDLEDKSPEQLIGMMWQLALDAWSFMGKLDAEPRLQRHVVVLERRKG